MLPLLIEIIIFSRNNKVVLHPGRKHHYHISSLNDSHPPTVLLPLHHHLLLRLSRLALPSSLCQVQRPYATPFAWENSTQTTGSWEERRATARETTRQSRKSSGSLRRAKRTMPDRARPKVAVRKAPSSPKTCPHYQQKRNRQSSRLRDRRLGGRLRLRLRVIHPRLYRRHRGRHPSSHLPLQMFFPPQSRTRRLSLQET